MGILHLAHQIRQIILVSTFALTLSVAQKGPDPRLPRFEGYRVAELYRGSVLPPRFGDLSQYSGADLRCFSGDPEDYAKELVNFAGHFVIESCTCGSGCHYLFMWDAATGRFYRITGAPINTGPFDVGTSNPVSYKGEEFHVDSSLLVIDGCVGETCNCGTRYYRWNGRAFDLLARRASRLPSRCRPR